MDSYLDTSFVMKLYVAEAESPDCIEWLRQNRSGACVSSLVDLEVSASITRAFKADPGNGALVLGSYRLDRAAGVFRQLAIDDRVYQRATQFAEQYTNMLNLRSLDTIHLATALYYGLSSVGTYDKRLREAALALGLTVLPA